MSEFLISVASSLAAVLIVYAANEVRRAARTVAESAKAVSALTQQVGTLVKHDAQNRERIAALWARVFPEWSHDGH